MSNPLDDIKKDFLGDDDDIQSREGFYADDVEAQAIVDRGGDAESLVEDDDFPVTSGNMEIGDMDTDKAVGRGSEDSYDEEDMPGGDNVVG